MIIYPFDWYTIGAVPNIKEIENRLISTLKNLNCKNLALSGGIDSSYMLWCMTQVFGKENIKCYTIALSHEHPDYIHSRQIVKDLGVINWSCYFPSNNEVEELLKDKNGDSIVEKFFVWLSKEKVEEIICCDGIDEFMGGYYAHLHNPTHETYYDFMNRLQEEQLKPLNKNSANIKVFLPYLEENLIKLYNSFTMKDRFDYNDRKKVIKLLSKGKISDNIINRRKYGFIDAMVIKEV
jgi:asparagine synthetase B (glutamine-hydrolysing)